MFMFAIFLAVISTAMEMTIVVKVSAIKRLFERFTFVGLAFSFLLSYGIGVAFGAGGLIAMTAGVLSTMISFVIYASGILEQMTAANLAIWKAQITNVIVVTGKTIRLIWLTITAPVRFAMWCHRKYASLKASTSHLLRR